ncbi:hypothetical protein OIU76_005298, partial [Salix suchowensis]
MMLVHLHWPRMSHFVIYLSVMWVLFVSEKMVIGVGF